MDVYCMEFKSFTQNLQEFTPPSGRFKKQKDRFLVQRRNTKEYSKMNLNERLKMLKKEGTEAEVDTSDD